MANLMNLKDIIITDGFANSNPRKSKMQECRAFWNKYGKQDRYLVINYNNVLIDGYVQYLVLQENGIEKALIRKRLKTHKKLRRIDYTHELKEKRRVERKEPEYKNKTTTYVYGIHENSNSPKVYMWRVPKNWNEWSNGLEIGDSVWVTTKYGNTKIKIVDIKTLDKCPIECNVKKICSKKIIKDSNVNKGE